MMWWWSHHLLLSAVNDENIHLLIFWGYQSPLSTLFDDWSRSIRHRRRNYCQHYHSNYDQLWQSGFIVAQGIERTQPQWQTFWCNRSKDLFETNLVTSGLIARRLWCRIGHQVITRQQKSCPCRVSTTKPPTTQAVELMRETTYSCLKIWMDSDIPLNKIGFLHPKKLSSRILYTIKKCYWLLSLLLPKHWYKAYPKALCWFSSSQQTRGAF
jgi:hypothetical protein